MMKVNESLGDSFDYLYRPTEWLFEGGRLSGTGAAKIIYIIRPGVDFQGHAEETRKC